MVYAAWYLKDVAATTPWFLVAARSAGAVGGGTRGRGEEEGVD
jgi:hypothetical protein